MASQAGDYISSPAEEEEEEIQKCPRAGGGAEPAQASNLHSKVHVPSVAPASSCWPGHRYHLQCLVYL